MINLLKPTEINEVSGMGPCVCTISNREMSMNASGDDQVCIKTCGEIYKFNGEGPDVSLSDTLKVWGKWGAGVTIALLEVAGGLAVVGLAAAVTLAGGSVLYCKIKKL